MKSLILVFCLCILTTNSSFAKDEFIPIDPHGGNIGSLGSTNCSFAMRDSNKQKVMGYVEGYLAGVHAENWLNRDLTENRYKSVSSDTGMDTVYLILRDMCKRSPRPLFDLMNPLRNKLIQMR